jgi:hypothetical protein
VKAKKNMAKNWTESGFRSFKIDPNGSQQGKPPRRHFVSLYCQNYQGDYMVSLTVAINYKAFQYKYWLWSADSRLPKFIYDRLPEI